MSEAFLRRREVEVEVGLSKATIYRKVKDGTFPAPVRIGENSVRWPADIIAKWKAERPLATSPQNS